MTTPDVDLYEPARKRANSDTARVAGSLLFILLAALLDIAAAAGAAVLAFVLGSGGLWSVVIGVVAAGAGALIAVVAVWTFQLIRAPLRQRNEALTLVAQLTAVTPFPNVAIDIERLQQFWQDHAGKDNQPRCNTQRVVFPVLVTNREQSRRVSLAFDVTISSPDGSGVLAPRLLTEQQNELPLLVDPQDSKRVELSVFLNEYVAQRLRTESVIGGKVRYDINGDLFRVNILDLLSQKRIEMRLPGFYPQEEPPAR